MTYRIGLTLLHFCWEGALLAAALAIVLTVLRRARPEARYAAACAALGAMALAPLVTFLRLAESPNVLSPIAAAQGSGLSGPRGFVPSLAGPVDSVAPWIAICWLAGVALLTIRWGVAWALLQKRLAQTSVGAPPADLVNALERVRGRMRIAREIPVRMVDWVESPAVSRWIRPVLLAPAAAIAGLDGEQLEAILAHELAHIRRHDYLVNLLQTIIETLLFYHPAVWWASRQIRIEREHCCDDLAVSACGERHVYASALLKLEQQRAAQPQFVLAAGGGSLKSRIQRVLYPQSPAQSLWPASALLLTIALLFLWGGMRVVAQVPERPYSKWLNEEVVYIITAEEKDAFTGLRSDKEREQFVEQFWLRRDPTPGTAENEFRTEHYRRIAYANDRFEAGIPGWKTDRGRIYIMYGPPDEIESHARKGREAWRFRFIEGIGNNIDLVFQDGKLK